MSGLSPSGLCAPGERRGTTVINPRPAFGDSQAPLQGSAICVLPAYQMLCERRARVLIPPRAFVWPEPRLMGEFVGSRRA